MIIYRVNRGDSLYTIARRFGTSAQILARDNEINDPRSLVVGQKLLIFEPRQTYTVRRGDNLYSIAQQFGVSVNSLLRNNTFLGGRNTLEAGQVLTVIPEDTTYSKEISTNVYVYPNIDRDILRRTLPYLTYMTVFTYGIEEDGELIEIDDDEVIELAREYGVAPVMLVATLGENGKFSSAVAERVLGDVDVRNTLIEEIVMTLSRKRYVGVDIDFEYIPAEYADAYAQFIRALKARLEPLGFSVFVSLSPKTSDTQEGLLYEGHDYAALGEAADRAFLMTYEWGYTYGPPMAVSPFNKVEEVVQYAVSRIPNEKLVLGVPNYGYNWKLPFIQGESRAYSIGNTQAVELAREKRAAIEFDETAAAPYFNYYDRVNGSAEEHEVWFEDADSIASLISLVEEYGLDGIGVWNGTRWFAPLWQVINATYPIRKIFR
ncbi:MAG: LysM peptidoglycan-binding domain-containing protein [Ruminococcaceae bacterium]|nr:LysM peptidoglycan-binding domain-containing protein [Oscillospiraceae bacterium]